MSTINRTRKSALLGGSAMLLVLATSSGRMAENCITNPATLRGGFAENSGFAASTASSVAAALGNVSTAFLTQQGSAFVAAPANAPPNTMGGGVWARSVGGEVEVD